MQDALTSDFVHAIAELTAYFLRWYPFEPGDVITTGTPPGTGIEQDPPQFLNDGDTVRVSVSLAEIDMALMTLENPVGAG